jgi:hypothetical protein
VLVLDELAAPTTSSEMKGSSTPSPELNGELGNAWATRDPEMAANGAPPIPTESSG